MTLIVQTFWCEPSGLRRRSLRCYQSNDDKACPNGYCNATRPLDDVAAEKVFETDGNWHWMGYEVTKFPWDAFPTVCEHCRREMADPQRQIFCETLFRITTGPRAGEIVSERAMPVGAIWASEWWGQHVQKRAGLGGYVHVMLPDGDFCPDSRASNCTMKEDDVHRCWCRHGDPRTGYLHVDKDGNTCAAGGGSIWQRMPEGFHGFVHRGYVTDNREEVDRLIAAGQLIDAMAIRPVNDSAEAAEVVANKSLNVLVRTQDHRPRVVRVHGAWRSSRSGGRRFGPPRRG